MVYSAAEEFAAVLMAMDMDMDIALELDVSARARATRRERIKDFMAVDGILYGLGDDDFGRGPSTA